MKLTLVVLLKDGRRLAGTFGRFEALSRFSVCRSLPGFAGFWIVEAR